jgi:CheY-like chemotaxis protein
MKRILIVDDEQCVLNALRQLFAEVGYDIYMAESGSEALQVLAELLGRKLPESVSTAGLLQYTEILSEFSPNAGKSLTDLEYAKLGVSHHEIGGYLLGWWDIPLPIVECALFHHTPLQTGVLNRELVAVVHLANHYAWKAAGKNYALEPDAAVYALLGIAESDCRALAGGL